MIRMAHAARAVFLAALMAAPVSVAAPAFAQGVRGSVSIVPGRGTPEEAFQTRLVGRALEELGYRVKPTVELGSYADLHQQVADGRLTYIACSWDPLATELFAKAGGAAKLWSKAFLVPGSLQGYQVDRRTAMRHGIDTLDKLADPAIAAEFDRDGDGKADLVGCQEGWVCGDIIEHHLDAYGLRDTVTHHRTPYGDGITKAIEHFEGGKSILFYAYTPHWSNSRLVPGRDAIWLLVPFSALPGDRAGADTAQADGSNFGFEMNRQRIVANRAFVERHPDVARLFELMRLPVQDIATQNAHMRNGDHSDEAIERHVEGWITAHKATFDDWIRSARDARRR